MVSTIPTTLCVAHRFVRLNSPSSTRSFKDSRCSIIDGAVLSFFTMDAEDERHAKALKWVSDPWALVSKLLIKAFECPASRRREGTRDTDNRVVVGQGGKIGRSEYARLQKVARTIFRPHQSRQVALPEHIQSAYPWR